jgi:membrane dipeptidase
MTDFTWIDGHLDLAYLEVEGRDLTRSCANPDDECVCLPALRDARVDLVFGTIFTEPVDGAAPGSYTYPPRDRDAAERAGRRQLEVYERLERDGELSIVRTRRDLTGAAALPRVVLLMEGADPIRDPSAVPWWHDRGLRIVGMTWGAGTRYAGGNQHHGPLTTEGVELVRALDEAGIVHDASHLADAALDDLLASSTALVVATHSNCRALVGNDQRHLRDDQVEAIGRRGGVVGLNLFRKFLTADDEATVADCVRHVERVADIMGHRRGVGLGSDMDGGFGPSGLPRDVDHPGRLGALAAGLRDNGWSDDEISGFARENWMRVLEAALGEG